MSGDEIKKLEKEVFGDVIVGEPTTEKLCGTLFRRTPVKWVPRLEPEPPTPIYVMTITQAQWLQLLEPGIPFPDHIVEQTDVRRSSSSDPENH